jgi:hypothetical protein
MIGSERNVAVGAFMPTGDVLELFQLELINLVAGAIAAGVADFLAIWIISD